MSLLTRAAREEEIQQLRELIAGVSTHPLIITTNPAEYVGKPCSRITVAEERGELLGLASVAVRDGIAQLGPVYVPHPEPRISQALVEGGLLWAQEQNAHFALAETLESDHPGAVVLLGLGFLATARRAASEEAPAARLWARALPLQETSSA